MKVVRLETFLTNSGLRNYLFLRLTTDTGLTGIGEASLEWQEKAVQTLIHEWIEDRVLGIELDTEARLAHPDKKNSFPSLWDKRWLVEFSQGDGV